MAKIAVGIDIGGTGIKGALVDVKSGKLVSDRLRYQTPDGGSPKGIAKVVEDIVKKLDAKEETAIGICFPAVVQHGVTKSAANISKAWINLDARALFEKHLKRTVTLLNDADAAGYAEAKYGAAKDEEGLVVLTTLGTGIGVALVYDGKLIPNSELGHLEVDGVDSETVASFSAKERENLTWEEWAARLQKYYSRMEALLVPDLFIVGGGVSKEHEKFLPLLKLHTKIIPAELRNSAGIVGAAALAYKNRD